MKKPTVREQFERWYQRNHAESFTARAPASVWFKCDDIWGDPGYVQPCVHFEWLAYKAGHKAGRDLGRGRRGK